MEKPHHHPLNSSSICCPVHVYELLSIYTHQNREEEIESLLLYFSDTIETHFLLDNSEDSVDLKLKLGKFFNKYALKKNLELSVVKSLFETAFNLFSSLPESNDLLGYLATSTSNLAYISKEEGNLEKALKLLDKTLLIEKKISDSTGEMMTKINKAAILNEMRAYREAFFVLRDSVYKIEKKLSDMLSKTEEKDLKKSKKFKETLQLFLIACVNLVHSLENIDDSNLLEEANNKRLQAYELSSSYLGETHHLTRYFTDQKKLAESSFSSFSNLELSSSRNEGKNKEKRGSQNRITEKKHNEKNEEKKEVRDTPYSAKALNSSRYKPKNEIQVNQPEKLGNNLRPSSIETLKNPEKPKEKIEVKKIIVKDKIEIPQENQTIEKPEFIRKKISRTSVKSSAHSPSSADHSEVEIKVKPIRLPGYRLPFIPTRPSYLKHKKKILLEKNVQVNNFEYLLDPLKSPITKQIDFNISTIKIVNGLKRVITCCFEQSDNGLNLAITASSEDSLEELYTSEIITINDLKRILFFLCINDMIPTYMHPSFINNFDKFCQYFLMPYIRIIEVQESSSEKIELWARGESLLTTDSTHLFLNTECNIYLYFIEKFTLKMIICSIDDEESNEKCLRVDIELDETSAAPFIRPLPVPNLYSNNRFVQSFDKIDNEFFSIIDPIISEIELCIKDELGPRISFDEFIVKNSFLYIRAKVFGPGPQKVLYLIQDCKVQHGWKISVKRLHKVNSSGRTRSFSLTHFYPYFSIYLSFGLSVDNLDASQLQILAYFVMESLKVDIPIEDNLNNNEVSIIIMPVKTLKSFRSCLKESYKAPLTFSVAGVNGYLIGVRISLFNTEYCLEDSAWLILDGNFYKQKQPQVKRREKLKGALSLKFNETRLVEILEKEKGWEKILEKVKVDKSGVKIASVNGDVYIESFENVILKGSK